MRAENAPVYATKQAIRLPRAVSSMGITATRSNEEVDHSDGLASVLAADSSALLGAEPASPAISLSLLRAANALEQVSGILRTGMGRQYLT